MHEYSRRVFNLAYRFTGRHESAEDLTQEVFVRVYRSLDQYDPQAGDLANWLMRLARNLVIDDYRRRCRTPTDMGDDIGDHEYHLESRHDAPDRGVERFERAKQVHAAIARLQPDLRECVIL
ncbi:MAG TPA: sigma-70 family RNA polymerase sigma factor, partial [Blastocatellia bacterium]